MTHDALCHDLARHLRSQMYRAHVELRRVGVQSYGDAGRIDVLALRDWTGRVNFDMIAFEVKVSKGDLQRDVLSGKWRRYVTEYGVPRVAFAMPEEIYPGRDAIPADAGVWLRTKDGWKRSRAPRSLQGDQRKLDPLMLLAMLSDDPHDAYRRNQMTRRSRVIARLPESVRKAIDALGDDGLEKHAYAASYELGQRLSRLTKRASRQEKANVEKWIDDVIDAGSRIVGLPKDDFRASVASGYEHRLLRAMQSAATLYAHQGDFEKLLNALRAIGSGRSWFGDAGASIAAGLTLVSIDAQRAADEAERAKKHSRRARKSA